MLKRRFAKVTTPTAVAERRSPLLKMIPKPSSAGESIAEAVIFSGPQGWSATLPGAQAVSNQSDRGSSYYARAISGIGEYHGSSIVTQRAIVLGKTDADAYFRQLTETLDNALLSFGSIAAAKVFGPIGGSIGRVLAVNGGGAAGEFTLTVAGDTGNFQPGMIVQFADSTGAGVPTTIRAGLGYVVGVYPDNDAGFGHVAIATSEALRLAGTLGTPSGVVANDYIFRNGDVATGLDYSDSEIRSLQAWVTSAAASDTLNGFNRAPHGGLSGYRVAAADLAGMTVTQRIQKLCVNGFSQYGSIPDVIGLHPTTWQQLQEEISSYGKAEFGTDGKYGFTYLTVMCAGGPVKVVADPHVKEADIWSLDTSELRLYCANGEFPTMIEEDGNLLLRRATSADYEIRWCAYSNLTVNGNPWRQGRCASGN